MEVWRNREFSAWRTETKGAYRCIPLHVEKRKQAFLGVAQCEDEREQSQAAERQIKTWYTEKNYLHGLWNSRPEGLWNLHPWITQNTTRQELKQLDLTMKLALL